MAATYDLINYDSEAEQENDPHGPPRANLFAAAFYASRLLSANDIQYAIMGGFAMICRGSQRSTSDIDIVTEANMARLWDVITPQPRMIPLTSQHRLKIPNTRLIEGVIKVFVETGPKYNDTACLENRWIEVDLMIPGFKGTPTQLSSHIVRLPVAIGDEQHEIPCLDILYMMRSKLRHCVTRGMDKDVEDVQYLLKNFGTEISNIQHQLNQDEVDQFLTLDWAAAIPPSLMAYYRQTLGR
ncbi:hypothetical protein PRK78_000116 [Emydomyces testavorans]|uniref:Uncharacterized protein n=1 Tax=Emydomyces testavorans TaxID=2070801 RepID=A0AAF0DAV0_9EURO|nr:hypothetical protein PRK78_000116 [Emydomyces testavorans]